jgi:hypothetical protein
MNLRIGKHSKPVLPRVLPSKLRPVEFDLLVKVCRFQSCFIDLPSMGICQEKKIGEDEKNDEVTKELDTHSPYSDSPSLLPVILNPTPSAFLNPQTALPVNCP